jgi:predicted pyridoxine 5'-phosphate oxidase superfamily flavin-nucleotide-binding protein
MKNINEKIKKLIETNPVSLATVDKNGNPNVIGVAFVKVISPTKIIITDNYMLQTKENILKNKNVCLAVWNSEWKGYKLIGTAEYVTSGKWKKFVDEMPENKGLPSKGAILISISKLIKLG